MYLLHRFIGRSFAGVFKCKTPALWVCEHVLLRRHVLSWQINEVYAVRLTGYFGILQGESLGLNIM